MLKYNSWLPPSSTSLDEAMIVDSTLTVPQRLEAIGDWVRSGGILLMGYDMFRDISSMSFVDESSICRHVDVLVLDEGHRIRNFNSSVYGALSQVMATRKVFAFPISSNSLCWRFLC